MIRLLPLLLLLPSAALAEERRVALGSFERVRIDGAFAVTITTGSPGATVIGDRATIGDIDLHAEGTTLTVRRTTSGRWGEQRQATAAAPVRILLATPRLAGIIMVGGSTLSVAALSGPRVDLSAAGPGTIRIDAVQAEQLTVQLAGDGKVGLAGRATTARLIASGTGTIDAAGLEAGDLNVHLDGPGMVTGRARYTAQVVSSGLGTVTVSGRPKCRVVAAAGAPVRCGTEQ